MTSPAPAPRIDLVPLASADRAAWLARMEAAFAAGVRDAGLQPGEQPIPKAAEMQEELDAPGTEVLQIVRDGEVIGGAAIGALDQGRRSLELLFIDAGHHGGGAGSRAWEAIEARYPDTEVWETDTPYFDQRNIHFYINRCGFHAVEFFHPGHRREHGDDRGGKPGGEHDGGPDRMFRFEKRMPSARH
ncbi:hypothetical protein MTES_1392 [Microbacterium testaceum StLB037]|uniref:N-acetyltransferase domain-containing protein n=1 Tax=Microbacterium testaceum (strain StLB037) TaxID=979556 RepID=E8N8B1_MICTS|nr:GNAT family N-acetyltransferase [Microbacterium testaceum]BAJ74356.1 hypothetical protein MTES_1392 [Microbacterium testaceum StLB037]